MVKSDDRLSDGQDRGRDIERERVIRNDIMHSCNRWYVMTVS